jgi:hypothetical protein
MRRWAFAFVVLFLFFGGAESLAAAPATMRYNLSLGSALEVGCHGPCECAIRSVRAAGSFLLVPRGFDGLYQNYDVTRIDWRAGDPAVMRRFTGSGRYRVGGEVAVLHELTLDLVPDKGAPERFASGLVPRGGTSPNIVIRVSTFGTCFDSTFVVHAEPAAGGGDDLGRPALSAMRTASTAPRRRTKVALDRSLLQCPHAGGNP